MAILDSIALETQATIAGVLILLIITLLELIDLRSARRQHRQQLQAIASTTAPAQKTRLISSFSLALEFIFGFSAFALFVFGMMYLIIKGMPVLAGVAGISAFIAVMTPFIIWSVCRKANQETAETIKNAQQHRQESARQQKTSETLAAPVDIAPLPVVEESLSIVNDSAAKEPAQPAKPLPVRKPQPVAETEARQAPYPKPDPAHAFPQDSMLRRHFTAHLVAVAKPYEPSRPTDSILQRHYDTLSAHPSVIGSAKPVLMSAHGTTPTHKCPHPVKLPEDSMLKRHSLATLQLKIEPHLSLPEQHPTDSILRRHFVALKENLIAAELNKYLKG
ncbi:MAG: hypothetical protein ACR65R_20395 [Methylomicrobium sp.]